jgi:alpha-glucosidase
MSRLKWWQKAVFYQIYPRSFADANGDGIGDLPGAIQKLDYLQDLGVDAIWLSPHFPSPQFDCGYDVSDYTGVDPDYGTLEDFRLFLEGAHRRGMRVVLDLVLNHTSDQHSWFLESRSSRTHPKRDWYIWRDGVEGGPPNNWYSTFGGPAWTLDPLTGQYYYHFFFKEQPDLNWRNPEVKHALFAAIRFWLDMGVDGFRLDAIGTLYEDPALPDHSVQLTLAEIRQAMDQAETEAEKASLGTIWEELFKHQVDQPGVHELFQELRALIDEYEDRVLIGETDDLKYHGQGDDELHMVFNFPLMRTPRLTPSWVRQNQEKRLEELRKISPQAWPCNTLGNHDSPRIYSRYGDGANDAALARLNLALILTLRGTPFLYNGEEIGMTDLLLDDISQFRDLLGVWYYQASREEMNLPSEQALARAAQLTRDKNRTPMQWTNAPNGGFSPPGVHTWLPVNPNYAAGVNVSDQLKDPDSLLHFYRRILAVRRENPALVEGEYRYLGDDRLQHPDRPDQDYILAFLRQSPGQTCLVVLNYSNHPHRLEVPRLLQLQVPAGPPSIRPIFSTHQRVEGTGPHSHLEIAPFEVYIAQLKEPPTP